MIKPKIEREIKQNEEELQGENEKFQMAVCDVMDKWICQASDEGLFSSKGVFGFTPVFWK